MAKSANTQPAPGQHVGVRDYAIWGHELFKQSKYFRIQTEFGADEEDEITIKL
jgi:hypothetical protein